MFRIDSITTTACSSSSSSGNGDGGGGGGGGTFANGGKDFEQDEAEERHQERDLLFLSLLFRGAVLHHPIVTRSDQLYLGTRPFDTLEAMVLYHTQPHEVTGDLTLQCPLGQCCSMEVAPRRPLHVGELHEDRSTRGSQIFFCADVRSILMVLLAFKGLNRRQGPSACAARLYQIDCIGGKQSKRVGQSRCLVFAG